MGGPAREPRDEGSDGAFAEDGDHVPYPVRLLRVLLQDLEGTRFDAGAGVMSEHAVVPEDVDEIARRRRGWQSHGDGLGDRSLWNRRSGYWGRRAKRGTPNPPDSLAQIN